MIPLQVGEVAHLAKQVRLPRPDGGSLITKYMAELMLQTTAEVRPAPKEVLYLKRLALRPFLHTTSDADDCATGAMIVAGEDGRRTEVEFPHPYGIRSPNASDAWLLDLHVIRMDGLAGSQQLAQQCVCMREDIGSVHCCPHGCRFAVRDREAPVQQARVSLMVTWLLESDEDGSTVDVQQGEARHWDSSALTSMWLPVGPGGACQLSEFDADATCMQPLNSHSRLPDERPVQPLCALSRRGQWVQLGHQVIVVVALPILSPTMQRLVLVDSATQGSNERPTCTCIRAASAPCSPCHPSSGGERKLQAQADFNASKRVRGAHVGWHLWLARAALPR